MDKIRPMLAFYSSISLAALATLFYHICQKSTPTAVNPALALTVTYAVSAGLSLMALFTLFPLQTDLGTELRHLNGWSYALALAIAGIEICTLLAYRAGWKVSVAALLINVTASLLLIPVGYFIFKDKLTPLNLVGAGVCIVGLVMMNLKF